MLSYCLYHCGKFIAGKMEENCGVSHVHLAYISRYIAYTGGAGDEIHLQLSKIKTRRWIIINLSLVCCRYICTEDWKNLNHEQIYSAILMSLQFIVPLTVLVFTYTRIAVVVWGEQKIIKKILMCTTDVTQLINLGKKPPGEAENLRDLRMARSKRKVST